jgi:hypothetical protein
MVIHHVEIVQVVDTMTNTSWFGKKIQTTKISKKRFGKLKDFPYLCLIKNKHDGKSKSIRSNSKKS